MSRRILVVEDNDDIALVVKTTLTMRDYEVDTASDGRAGLKMAQSGRYDLMVLDVILPELDGYEVLRRVKADPATADLPIALFSAHVSEQDRIEALEAGASAVLVKPFHPGSFLAEIRAILADE